jgi:hypothetical protein
MIKKLVSSILTATMLCAYAIPTTASSWQAIDDIIDETRNDIEFLESTIETQYGEYILGNVIPLYIVDGADIVPVNDMQIYPIYGDNNVVGIYEVYSYGGSSFGSSYAPKIDEVVKNGMTEFFMLTNGNEIYLSDGDNIELLFKVSEGGMRSGNEKVVPVTSVAFSLLKSMVSNLSAEKNTDFSGTGAFGIADITPLTAVKLEKIDSITYVKNSDGSIGKKYNGWAKSGNSHYYYKDGIRVTGVVVMNNGDRCYFDKDGKYLNKRNVDNGFNILFPNDYAVNLSEKAIAFSVEISDLKGLNNWDYSSSQYFDLYVFKEGKWVSIPYAYELFLTDAVGVSDDGIMNFSKGFSHFKYDFEPGLYRVKVIIAHGEFDEDGEPILDIVRGEFNIK